MFSGLTDLGMRRTPLQALGFYLAYSIGLVIVLAILGAVVGTIASLVFGDVAIAINKAMTAFGAISAVVLCGGNHHGPEEELAERHQSGLARAELDRSLPRRVHRNGSRRHPCRAAP